MATQDSLTRRDFMKTGAVAAGAIALSAKGYAQVAGANGRLRVGIIGCEEELDAYLAELGRLRMMLVESDGDALEAVFERARTARNAWAEGLPVRNAE